MGPTVLSIADHLFDGEPAYVQVANIAVDEGSEGSLVSGESSDNISEAECLDVSGMSAPTANMCVDPGDDADDDQYRCTICLDEDSPSDCVAARAPGDARIRSSPL